MATPKFVLFRSLCLSAGLIALPAPAALASGTPQASGNTDTQPQPQATTAPSYGSYDSDRAVDFNTPEADARPGKYYFDLGAAAAEKKDYAHAIAMYKVAASWAYKPAEYNLAVMYVRGEGVPADLPTAMAWMTLAAERNDAQYVKARELIHAHLTPAQFDQANAIYSGLLPTYGDAVALHRAKMRWEETRAAMTGSRVGGQAGELIVGANDGGHYMAAPPHTPGAALNHVNMNAADLTGGNHMDGSLAYQQLRSSNNPYDPQFVSATGTTSVGPLTPIKAADAKAAEGSKPAAPKPADDKDGPSNP